MELKSIINDSNLLVMIAVSSLTWPDRFDLCKVLQKCPVDNVTVFVLVSQRMHGKLMNDRCHQVKSS